MKRKGSLWRAALVPASSFSLTKSPALSSRLTSSIQQATTQRRTLYEKNTIFAVSAGRKVATIDKEFPLELGGSLPKVDITWEEWGNVNNPNVVFIFPSLSVGSHARSSVEDPKAGWWEAMIGPDKGIDTDKFRVICASGLGSPFGTTSPVSENPGTGKEYGPTFPQITPRDMARCHKLLLDHLQIPALTAGIGASLGGCVALSFAAEFPEMAKKLCVISATGKSTPRTVALRHIQRQAILRDPDYCGGNYKEHGKKPANGMAVARQLGLITYRSVEEFNQKFRWNDRGEYKLGGLNFEVEEYLQHKAKDFVDFYDANCYILLSKCTDLMDLGRSYSTYSEGALRIKANTLVMGVESDIIIPLIEQQHIFHLLQAHGREVALKVCTSIYGHDSFLLDFPWFIQHIRHFLEGHNRHHKPL